MHSGYHEHHAQPPKIKPRALTFKTQGNSSVGEDLVDELEQKEIELEEAKKLIIKLQKDNHHTH